MRETTQSVVNKDLTLLKVDNNTLQIRNPKATKHSQHTEFAYAYVMKYKIQNFNRNIFFASLE